MATPIPDNHAPFTLGEISALTRGVLSGDPGLTLHGVATDTRRDLSGRVFIALRGDAFDAHSFVADAALRGAAAVVVDRGDAVPAGVPHVVVSDTLAALGALARGHRRRWDGVVVAVAGSAGKTTTRSCAAAALTALYPGAVHSTPGNLNNRIGVPMVLLGLEERHRAVVVEIGTNLRGEVALLADIAAPDLGVVTLVDVEHAEGIGDIDAIEAEEGDLFASVSSSGTALGNGDDERVVRQLGRSGASRRLTYGESARADYRIVDRPVGSVTGGRLSVERPGSKGRETVALECSLVGLPGALATTAGLAVADVVAGEPMDPERVRRAMGDVGTGEGGRLVPVSLSDGTLVIDDTYNANPGSVISSARAAREVAETRGVRLHLVLGEMRELGPDSRDHHRSVGRAVAGHRPASVVGVVGDARFLVDEAIGQGVDAVFAASTKDALALLLARLRPGDVVLVKASRGVHAERVVEGLVREKGGAA